VAGRLRRVFPPAVMVFGLFLFGVSLVQLGTEASPDEAVPLHPGSLTVANGTAALLYPVGYFGYRSDHIDVQYAFPQAAGAAYFVDCYDAAALAGGHPPATPLLAFTGLRSGSFVVSTQTLPPLDPYFSIDQATNRPCDPAVAFTWAATDPEPNRPEVSVLYYEAGLGSEGFFFLAVLMGGSALLTLLGGLAWVRGSAPSGPPGDGSTVEALRAALDQIVAQLERTRKNLLFAGILGVFLWYPFLVPWAWQQAQGATDDPTIPWGVAGLTLVFLVVLTVLWAREFVRLDRQLNAWRARLGELRSREQRLMESLEQGG